MAASKASLEALDRNGDGFISKQEWTSAHAALVAAQQQAAQAGVYVIRVDSHDPDTLYI